MLTLFKVARGFDTESTKDGCDGGVGIVMEFGQDVATLGGFLLIGTSGKLFGIGAVGALLIAVTLLGEVTDIGFSDDGVGGVGFGGTILKGLVSGFLSQAAGY